jgi:hypothetical protein
MFFIDGERGWVIVYGAVILRTENGGKSWTDQPCPDNQAACHGILSFQLGRLAYRARQITISSLVISHGYRVRYGIFLWGTFPTHDSFSMEAISSYLTLLAGVTCEILCFKALFKAKRKVRIALFTIVLTPFAFSYPAWLAIIAFLYYTKLYTGPMP